MNQCFRTHFQSEIQGENVHKNPTFSLEEKKEKKEKKAFLYASRKQ